MDFFKSLSDKVGSIIGPVEVPSYTTWFVLPLMVTLGVMAYLGYLLFRNWDTLTICDDEKTVEVNEESDDEKKGLVYDEDGCREVEFKPVWRFLIVLVVGTVVAAAVAAGVYRTVLYAKNPRIGMGIEATRYFTDAFN